MRFPLVVLLAASALQLNGFAQVPSVVEGSTFEARPGQWHRLARNQSPSPMLAFSATSHCPRLGPGMRYDALVYSANSAIQSGESAEIQAGDPSKCSGSVNAAVFADGHVEGDPKSVDDIYSVRRGAYKALGESIELLNSIRDQHESMQHVAETLNARLQASFQQRTESALGYNLVCSIILRTLRETQVHTQLPSDNDAKGEKLPSVEEVMNATGLSHDEARAIVFTRRLEQWKSLLKRNLTPRP